MTAGVIVLVCRYARADREKEFVAAYKREKPNHPGFIDETLARIDHSADLPEPMRSLTFDERGAVIYLNVARWRSAADFYEHFKPKTTHDPEIECADRRRAVFNILDLVESSASR